MLETFETVRTVLLCCDSARCSTAALEDVWQELLSYTYVQLSGFENSSGDQADGCRRRKMGLDFRLQVCSAVSTSTAE